MHGLFEVLQNRFKNYYQMETFAFFYSYQYIRSAIIYTLYTILREECKNHIKQI